MTAHKILKKMRMEAGYLTGKIFCPPEFVSLLVTYRCNLKCQACNIWKKQLHEELDLENWKVIVGNLAPFLDKNSFMEINGGEPLLRKDLIFGLIRELKKHFLSVTLNTNGFLLDEKNAKMLKESNLDKIKVSLYSLDDEIHDNLRGMTGSCRMAKRAIELAREIGLGCEAGILITNQNMGSLTALLNWLRNQNIPAILQPLDEIIESVEAGNVKNASLPLFLWPKKKAVHNFFRQIFSDRSGIKNSPAALRAMRDYYLHPESSLSYRCFAGQRNLVIYPDGNLSFCFKGKTVGNIVRLSFDEINKGLAAGKERKRLRKCSKFCRVLGCNFNRGLLEHLKHRK